MHESTDRPNIFLIICDHLSTRVVGRYGEGSDCTPNINAIAEDGVTFANAYTPCPLCMPARAAFWSSLYPHQTRVQSNGRKHDNGPLPDDLSTMGTVFSDAGYRCMHFGKTHDFGTLKGFETAEQKAIPSPTPPHPAWPENNDTLRDNYTVQECEKWLRSPPENEPFFCVADLQNPHNICGWVGENNSMETPVNPVPIPGELPELPDNFSSEDLQQRPVPVQYICCTHNRQAQTQNWTRENYRHYVAAFQHYSRRVDAEIGRLMSALEAGGNAENTIVVVMADHGDSQASHGLVTKQVHFYEETARVPLIFAGPGIRRQPDLAPPLASLLDLMPTFCGLTGTPMPDGKQGLSLAPYLADGTPPEREYVASEWFTEWGFEYSPGRMLRTERYKYTRYLEGSGEELYDLTEDPGEMHNLATVPQHQDILKRHRELLQHHVVSTNDDFFDLEVIVDPRWRSHQPGWQNHEGVPAPMAED